MRGTVKPISVPKPYAKQFREDEKRHGREVAIYNLGFTKGWKNRDGKKSR